MAYFLSPIGNSQQFDANGNPLTGGKINTYLSGSTTPTPTYTDNSGATPQANPIVLNSLGLPASPIWLTGSIIYKFVITDSANVVLRTVDNISGVNDTSANQSEWVESGTVPTFISATSFSVPGDQTSNFQVGRRLRSQNTAGKIYSSITASTYTSPKTTVTVSNDSGVLDSGLSSVSYGILAALNRSIPGLNILGAASLGANTFTGAQTLPAAGAILTGATSGTTTLVAGAVASGTATLPTAGGTLATLTGTETLSNKTLVAPALGTPASGTLTNATGLPAAGVVGTAAILGANTFTGTQALSGAALNEAAEVSIASAATVDIGAAASNNVLITGTTTITSLGTAAAGITRKGRFAGALTLTYNATSLILPGAANITTAANHTFEALSLGSGNWIVTKYQKANGTAVVSAGLTLGTPVATTSGTSVDITGIPAGTKQIIVSFDQTSTNGTSTKMLQIGTAAGIETTGYLSESVNLVASPVTSASTAGFIVNSAAIADALVGSVILTLLNSTTNTWAITGVLGNGDSNNAFSVSGRKALVNVLDRVRITTTGGTNTFDLGEMNIAYQ